MWCGYCVSVSLGIGASYLFWIDGLYQIDPRLMWLAPYEPIAWGFAVHRLSNVWHEAISRFLKQIPFSLFLRVLKHREPGEGE